MSNHRLDGDKCPKASWQAFTPSLTQANTHLNFNFHCRSAPNHPGNHFDPPTTKQIAHLVWGLGFGFEPRDNFGGASLRGTFHWKRGVRPHTNLVVVDFCFMIGGEMWIKIGFMKGQNEKKNNKLGRCDIYLQNLKTFPLTE